MISVDVGGEGAQILHLSGGAEEKKQMRKRVFEIGVMTAKKNSSRAAGLTGAKN